MAAHTTGIENNTKEKFNLSWSRWTTFIERVGLPDSFINDVPSRSKIRLLWAFMEAMWRGDFDHQCKKGVWADTARVAAAHISAVFRACNWQYPALDQEGKTNSDILHQSRRYKNLDKPTKQQKSLPIFVFRFILHNAQNSSLKAKAHLTAGALFFSMSSYEYTEAGPNDRERRTITIWVKDVKFYRGRKLHSHRDKHLDLADSVSITFHLQRRENEIGETINMHRTPNPQLKPVLHWAYTTRRGIKIKDSTLYSLIDTIATKNVLSRISSQDILHLLHDSVTAIGKDSLGFASDKIGTHSIWSSSAIAMYLANVLFYTIMLTGRWSSDAFLRYICKQVQDFTIDIFNKMLITKDFFIIHDQLASSEDPWARGNTQNFATQFFGVPYWHDVTHFSYAIHHQQPYLFMASCASAVGRGSWALSSHKVDCSISCTCSILRQSSLVCWYPSFFVAHAERYSFPGLFQIEFSKFRFLWTKLNFACLTFLLELTKEDPCHHQPVVSYLNKFFYPVPHYMSLLVRLVYSNPLNHHHMLWLQGGAHGLLVAKKMTYLSPLFVAYCGNCYWFVGIHWSIATP